MRADLEPGARSIGVPIRTPVDLPAEIYRALRHRLGECGFSGDIATDMAARAATSTDNSVYQIMPGAVVAPRNGDDVRLLLQVLDEPRFRSIAITARGGGTGTNGQSLNHGVIVDFRRHMHRIVALDTERGFVDVEPGIVLDDLNRQLAPHGLFFAPNTSTSNRCTIGGMVSTDASGKGSRIYGKTGDNVLGLELMLAGGRVLDSLGSAPAEWAAPMLEAVADACDSGRSALLANVPQLSRRFSGLDLERARPTPDHLEWWRLAIGAEGILGLVTRIRLKLVSKPSRSVLVVLGFDSFSGVLDATQALLPTDPLAIEVMDEWVQSLAQGAGLLDSLPDALQGIGARRPVYAFVEFAGDDLGALEERAARCVAIARTLAGFMGSHVESEPAAIAHLWSVRAASVGLLGASSDARRPISFVEDCVVLPENLAAFVADFSVILRRYGLKYGIYGHADVGCLHTRPALDMADAEDRRLYKKVSDDVFAAATRHGGIFWGEHGKGIRGEYLERFVGAQAFDAFKQIKRAFDPGARFNPGKLIAADGALYGIATAPLRATRAERHDPFAEAYGCNGNALCLNYAAKTPMCPSFKISADVRHSPKGRAEALRHWSQAAGEGRADPQMEQDLHAALDGCLGCKSCAGACPTHIDIPELKSRFLDSYHRHTRRRLSDLAAIWLEALSPWLVRLAPSMSWLSRMPFYGWASRRMGIVDPPNLSDRTIAGAGLQTVQPGNIPDDVDVLLLQDPFTSLFDVASIADIAGGLKALGFRPAALPLIASGKAAHVKGSRARFERQARALASLLRQAAQSGRQIVGIDPALVYMLRSEYVRLGLGALPPVLALEEFLLAHAGRAEIALPENAIQQTVFLHCTEKSMRPRVVADWIAVMRRYGIHARVAETGCCGMSGMFGHETRHQDWSRGLYDMSWQDRVDGEQTVYATGFSCRCQVKRFAGKPVRHPMALIAAALAGARHPAPEAGTAPTI